MAFAIIETRAESNVTSAGTSHAVTKPSGTASGDLWVIFFGHAVACTLNALAGYTELVDTNSANSEKILYRLCDGTEGASVTFTSSASTKSAHLSYRISGAENPSTQAPQLSTVATGTSTTPNATTCTPTGGAKDYLWITAFVTAGEEADDDTWGGAAPTNYANAIYKTTAVAGTPTTNCSVAASDRSANAASEDALAWGANAQSLAWRAWTIAVHPSSTVITDRTITSIARISKVVDRTITSVARISKVVDKTITSIARISKIVDKPIDSIARISKVVDQPISSIARIAKVVDKTITSIANIATGTIVDKTITSIANIRVSGDFVSPGTAGTSARSGSVYAWNDVNNILTSNDTRAWFAVGAGSGYTQWITATNFGFNIPAGNIILGILVEAEVSKSSAQSGFQDSAARIIKGGVIGATDKANATGYTQTEAYLSHGGSTDIWGESWTPADINANNFGFALSTEVITDGGSGQALIDHIRIAVYYTQGADRTITSIARISKIVDKTISSIARISKTTDQTIVSQARISKIVDKTITSIARIAGIVKLSNFISTIYEEHAATSTIIQEMKKNSSIYDEVKKSSVVDLTKI